MRFLHTSDWHLGRRFHGTSLQPAQELVLEHLVTTAQVEQVDAVLVSGDVYDRALPPPESVELLSRTLRRLVQSGIQVVLTAGNHDSPTRLGFAAEVLELAGVHLRTGTDRLTEPVRINDVDVYALPYLEPTLVADQLGAAERTHAAVLRAALHQIEQVRAPRSPAVVMAHVFAAGATTSESERDVSVGGLGVVPARLFEPFDYAALGHLHRSQQLTDRAWYSGSPVAMSFSEADQVKSSLLVDLSPGRCEVRPVAAPVWRALTRLRGSLDQLLDDPALARAQDSWCEATLTDAERPPRAMERLRQRFPHCVSLRWEAISTSGTLRSYAERLRGRDDLELCCDFVQHVRGRAAEPDERALLTEALGVSSRDRRLADTETDGRSAGAA